MQLTIVYNALTNIKNGQTVPNDIAIALCNEGYINSDAYHDGVLFLTVKATDLIENFCICCECNPCDCH